MIFAARNSVCREPDYGKIDTAVDSAQDCAKLCLEKYPVAYIEYKPSSNGSPGNCDCDSAKAEQCTLSANTGWTVYSLTRESRFFLFDKNFITHHLSHLIVVDDQENLRH